MTDRPNREEVDQALAVVAEEIIGCDDPNVYLEVLAAEVRALRAEREAAEQRIVSLQYQVQDREMRLEAALEDLAQAEGEMLTLREHLDDDY